MFFCSPVFFNKVSIKIAKAFILILLLLSSFAGAAEYGFQGRAYERKVDGGIGDKLAGVNITYTSEDGSLTKNVTTDANGYYRIDLDIARYVVTANLSGYEDYSSSPGYFVCTGNGYQTGNFFLKKEDQRLIGYWKFDEGFGTTALDSSEYGYDGTINGAVYVPGKFGKALSFDGVNDFVEMLNSGTADHPLQLTKTDATIEFWIKAPEVKYTMALFFHYWCGGYYAKISHPDGWPYDDRGRIFTRYRKQYDSAINLTTEGEIDDNQWHHVVFTYNYYNISSQKVSIYIDGELDTSGEAEIGDIVVINQNLHIGANSDHNSREYFKGLIDEFQIYNYAKTSEQISIDAVKEPPDMEPPVVSILIGSDKVGYGEKVSVTVTGTDDKDLSAIWWWGDNAGNTDIGRTHSYNCSGTSATYTWSVDTINLMAGTYVLKASALDAAGNEASGAASVSLEVLDPVLYVEPLILEEIADSSNVEDTDFYRVYWDSGGDEIDYSEPIAVIENEEFLWEYKPIIIEDAAYNFVVRASNTYEGEKEEDKLLSIVKIDGKKKNVINSSCSSVRVVIPRFAFRAFYCNGSTGGGSGGGFGWGGFIVNNAEIWEPECEYKPVYDDQNGIDFPEDMVDVPLEQIENAGLDCNIFAKIIEEPVSFSQGQENMMPIEEKVVVVGMILNGKEPVLVKEILIRIPYNDSNNDGFVDGTNIPEEELVILWYNSASGEWERDYITYVDIDKNTCTTFTKKQGKFAIFSRKGIQPYPPLNLSGEIVDERKVKINWVSSYSSRWDALNIYIKDGKYCEKTYGIKYNIYFDDSTGIINYSRPLATLENGCLTWISDELMPGRYKFGVRVVDIEGNEEKNNNFIEIVVPYPERDARAYIKNPSDGKKISGNAVTIMAEATKDTERVMFQYKKKWIQPEPEIVDEMIMSCDGRVKITLTKASAGLSSDIYMLSPAEKLLIENNLINTGTVVEEEYKAGTRLNFFIRTYGDTMGLGTYDHYASRRESSDSDVSYCRIERLNLNTWQLSFEDLPAHRADWDYNDVVCLVEIIPSNDYENEVDSKWVNIVSDAKKPYSCYWNVSAFENGGYYLRAVAYDEYGNCDSEPTAITVNIDDVNWDIHEDGNPDVDPNNEHRKCEKIKSEKDAEVVIADGTSAIIPAGVVTAEEVVLDITIIDPVKMKKNEPVNESSVKAIGEYRKFEFQNGECLFDKDITLSIPYTDENDDDIVDGTDIKAEELQMFYLDEKHDKWKRVSRSGNKNKKKKKSAEHIINNREKRVTAKVNHFTIFALMAYAPADNLSSIIVYPNPFKPNSGLGHENIVFDGLIEEVKIQIFTIAGRLVREWEGSTYPAYQWEWDVKNDSGSNVVSGVYVYVVTADGKEAARGKIAVLR